MDAYVLMNLIPYHPIVLIFECSEELSKWMKIICLEPVPIQWPAVFRLEDRLPVDKWRGGIFPILYNHNNTLGARYFDPHFSVVISIGRILAAIGDELQSARTNGSRSRWMRRVSFLEAIRDRYRCVYFEFNVIKQKLETFLSDAIGMTRLNLALI